MPVTEPRRGRDRGTDDLDAPARALDRVLAPAPDDRTRDLARVALLAVVLEDPRQLALAFLVDELAGRELGGRVHAHVERRVGRVREAALGPVDLHRGDSEVEQDRVGAYVVRRELLEHIRELTAKEAALDPGALPHRVE